MPRHTTAPTYRRAGGPAAGTRPEVWSATSDDEAWTFERGESCGTPWSVRHNATGYVLADAFTCLPDGRRAITSGLIWRMLLDDAHLRLRTVPDGPSISPITPNDQARALLTWMVDEADHLVEVANVLDHVGVTR
jgi:hypothetical protein